MTLEQPAAVSGAHHRRWFWGLVTAIGGKGDTPGAVGRCAGQGGIRESEEADRGGERHRPDAETAGLHGRCARVRRRGWRLCGSWLCGSWLRWLAAVKGSPAPGLLRRAPIRCGRAGWCRQPGLRGRPDRHARTLIFDAFRVHRAAGPERAIAILAAAGGGCPPGAVDLFRAMSAASDDDWLAATNAWAAAAAAPRIGLRPGREPRFQRIEFEPVDPVPSPDRVTVIMPAYNARRTIESAIRSILSQSWRNLELIVVDDASGDGTAEVAERLAAADPRVVVLRNPVNVGPYVSKNRALIEATGRYVTGHDADDVALPTRIADQMRPIHAAGRCSATIAAMVRLDRDGAFSYPAKIGPYSYDGIARQAMISLLIERQFLLDRLGFWDSVRFGADSEMLARVTAVLGPRLWKLPRVVMLCLNAAGSLTNHPQHGINVWAGISPVRSAYREAWSTWHAASTAEERRLPFPHVDRVFPAPPEMLVARGDLEEVLGPDARPRRRAA